MGSHLLAIKACIHSNDIERGRFIIDCILDSDKLADSLSIELVHSMIDFCALSGDIEIAENIFHSVNVSLRSIVTLNAMMRCYFMNQRYTECLDTFHQILANPDAKRMKPSPNAMSYVFAIKSASQSTSFNAGMTLHEMIQNETSLISE